MLENWKEGVCGVRMFKRWKKEKQSTWDYSDFAFEIYHVGVQWWGETEREEGFRGLLVGAGG